MSFCTVINCMDGRCQLPVIKYLCQRFNVDYVDSITEPGPNLILAKQTDKVLIQSILRRVRISVDKHSSVGIAIVGHYDCAGNPAGEEEQHQHIVAAVEFLRAQYPEIPIIGLWLDEEWKIHEVVNSEQGAAPDRYSAGAP